MKRVLSVCAVVVVGLVVLAASAHAGAPEAHGSAECIACALCEWLNTLLT